MSDALELHPDLAQQAVSEERRQKLADKNIIFTVCAWSIALHLSLWSYYYIRSTY